MEMMELRSAYESGRSLSELGKKYGVAANTIRTRLLREGVVLRGQGCPSNRKRIELPVLELRQLREQGLTYEEIGTRYGVSEKTIRNRLR